MPVVTFRTREPEFEFSWNSRPIKESFDGRCPHCHCCYAREIVTQNANYLMYRCANCSNLYKEKKVVERFAVGF